jgi:hypothetical protein
MEASFHPAAFFIVPCFFPSTSRSSVLLHPRPFPPFSSQVADQVGGRWLAIWVAVAAACSQVGQYQAEMATDSYLLQV